MNKTTTATTPPAPSDWVHLTSTPFAGGSVERYRLANGLLVLIHEDRSAPVVTYHTWFRVGSRHEKPGKTGLAHLFEHLMFNETEGLKAGEFDEKLEENGAESNAATWVDWTYYYESLPKERLDLAIALEAERMSRLVLREPQVASEKDVVANERRYRVDDDVEGAASEVLYKTAFTVHPYHWPTIGWMDDILAFTPEDCRAFYRTFYAPNNAVVVVCGDATPAEVLPQIAKAYAHIGASEIPPEDIQPEPPQREPREVTLEKPTTSAKLYVGFRGPAFGDADHATLTVLNEILFGGRASRAHRTLVSEKELATDIRGWVSTFAHPGLYEMNVTARPPHGLAAIEVELDALLDAVKRDVVTQEELDRAKARLELSLLQSLDTAGGKAEQMGFYETMTGDPAGAFRRLEAYLRVTTAELRTAARRYLQPENRSIVRVLPEEEGGDDDDGDDDGGDGSEGDE
jgi:zinc protease